MSTASELEPPLELQLEDIFRWRLRFRWGWASFLHHHLAHHQRYQAGRIPARGHLGVEQALEIELLRAFGLAGGSVTPLLGSALAPMQGIDKPHFDNRRCPLRPLRTLPRSLLFQSSTPSDAPQASLDVGCGIPNHAGLCFGHPPDNKADGSRFSALLGGSMGTSSPENQRARALRGFADKSFGEPFGRLITRAEIGSRTKPTSLRFSTAATPGRRSAEQATMASAPKSSIITP